MISSTALQCLVSLVQQRVADAWGGRSEQDFDPRVHKRLIAESIAGVVVSAATTASRLSLDRDSTMSPFWELIEAGVTATPLETGVPRGVGNLRNIQEVEELYEAVIPIDFPMAETTSAPSNSSIAQKIQGTYYTPRHLASHCVTTCLDAFIERQLGIKDFSWSHEPPLNEVEEVVALFGDTKITDLSCGVGRFLVAAVQYVRTHVASHLCNHDRKLLATNLSRNLYGYDIDPIALGIARICLLEAIEEIGAVSDKGALFGNLLHANLLIPRCGAYVAQDAVRSYFEGFLYDSALGRPEEYRQSSWDIVIGNPPWEKIRLEERSFFEHFMAGIVSATSKSARQSEIESLKWKLPYVHAYYQDILLQIDAARKQIQADPLFSDSSCGELNTCALFAELALRSLSSQEGLGALLVKTSILTHYAHRKLFSAFQRDNLIVAVYDFTNRAKYFPIDGRERFSWFMFGGCNETITLAMSLEEPSEMRDASKATRVGQSTLRLLNPDTGMLPSVRSPRTLQMLVTVYERNSTFAREYPIAKYGRLVHLTTHSGVVHRENGRNRVPIIEGKFIERYDGRFAGFEGVSVEERFAPKATAVKPTTQQKDDPHYAPESRYFLDRPQWKSLTANHQEPWSIFWRSTTSSSNARTCIATLLPHSPAIQSLQMLQLRGSPPRELAVLLATMNSKVFDFLVRNKLAGIDLTQNVIKQVAVPPRRAWSRTVALNGVSATLEEQVKMRVAELLGKDARLGEFIRALNPTPLGCHSKIEILDQEIDLLVAIAYGLSGEEFDEILADFTTRSNSHPSQTGQSHHRLVNDAFHSSPK